jgi:hypothetical protein
MTRYESLRQNSLLLKLILNSNNHNLDQNNRLLSEVLFELIINN